MPRISTLVPGLVAVGLGIVFQTMNVAYMIGLTFSVAGSSTFPALLLALYWRRLTTIGAVVGGAVGMVAAVGLTIAGNGLFPLLSCQRTGRYRRDEIL